MFPDYLSLSYDYDTTTIDSKELGHYLPHQSVVREEKETKKVRIVFNASWKLKVQLPLKNILFTSVIFISVKPYYELELKNRPCS